VYILYYFKDYISGNKAPQQFLTGISITGLIVFVFCVIFYYIFRGIGWITNPRVQTSDTRNSTTQTIYYIILFIFICILYLYYRNNLSSSTNPYVNLIINILFYIPCLFIDFIEYIKYELKVTTNTIFILFLLEI
jgi:hypothetical protein